MNWPVSLDGVLSAIVQNEGGYVNDPADSGGATRWGVTQATLADWRGHPVTAADVQALSDDEAKLIYKARYIDGPGFSGIESFRLLYELADTSVLFGPKRATQFLQTALGISVDGVCGQQTVDAANRSLDPRGIVNQIAKQRIRYHCQRVTIQPDQARFLLGWIDRASEFIE